MTKTPLATPAMGQQPRGRRRCPRPLLVLAGALALGVLTALAPAQADTRARVSGARSPEPSVRAAFYYPWYPETEHWQTRFHPSLGRYDSSDERVLDLHVRQAQYARLDAFISSYWGRDSRTGRRLPALLGAARERGFHIAAYYERESEAVPPSPAALRADVDALARLAADPAWLRVRGRPVLFVYNTGREGSCAGIDRLRLANRGRFYLNAKVFPGYESCPHQPDSWHQYGPAARYDQQGHFSATVSPGFSKFDESRPRLARDLRGFVDALARQERSGAQWLLTTSFNEWGEGTAVEPAAEWASASGRGAYLDALRSARPPTAAPARRAVTPRSVAGG